MTQELPEGTVTVLFTDVAGSTELTNRLGDAAARDVLGACDELVRQQIERHRGREVKGTGDGLMVAFTSARRAIACAVDIQREIAERTRNDPDWAVGVKIGLNTGEVIREEADLFGATVNAAARIADHASAGEILLPDAVKGVLGAATTVELEDRGETELKGFPEPWRLYAVSWEEKSAGPAFGGRTPYVGRAEERAQLRGWLDEAVQGKGALVMIGGEPGVGKTRLTQELADEARQRNMLALTGRCYEMEGAPPYIPFVEILEAVGRTVPPEAFREALGDAAPEVAKLMPELRRMFPDIPASPELPPEQERRYLFNGTRDFIARAGQAQPLLLVLDDLQWADDATLLLLQHIAQQLHEMPILILGTYRDVELDVARPLARALEELLRQRLARRIALKRLPEDGVSAMLRELSGQEPPQPLVGVIYSETEGNPFFVEEVFQHLAEEGKLFDAQGRWRPDLEVSELDVPESVRLVIGRRLERVSEECRSVLTTAAVIGRAFNFELLEALSDPSASSGQAPSASSGHGMDADALLDAVDDAERAQLITSTSDAEARFTFAHELIRQTLLSGVSAARRQRLHLRVAEAIELVYASALEERAADLAHHLVQAGNAADSQKTVHYLTLAGERALQAVAFEDALRLYESALSLQPGDDTRGRAELFFKRGSALRSLGRWDDALVDWREALAAYEELGDAEAAGRISSEIVLQLTRGAFAFAEALEIGQRGLTALGEQVSVDRCRLLGVSGIVFSLAGSYAVGDGMIAQSIAMAEQLGDQKSLGESLAYKTVHHWFHMQIREVLNTGLRAASLLRSTGGDLWYLADVLWSTQFSLLWLGRFDEASKIGEELEPLATRLGQLTALTITRRGRAFRDLMLAGDIDEYEVFARADLELCLSGGLPQTSHSYSLLGVAHFWRGRWEEALASFQEAVKLEFPGAVAGLDWALLFLMTAYAGNKDEALAMLDEKRGGLPQAGQANAWGAWTMLLAVVEGLAVLGERDEASKLYPLVLELGETGTLMRFFDVRLLQTVAGIAAAAGGQWEKAEEHYESALRQAHELPNKMEQPEVRRWYARMLIDRNAPGDRDKAFRLLTEAIGMYREIGMPKHVEMAEGLLELLAEEEAAKPHEPQPPSPEGRTAVNTTIVASPEGHRSFASGRYVVQRLLGQGAQKSVYLVDDTELERECALSLIKADLLNSEDLGRLRREAQAMARLTHANIVTVHDIGEDGGRPYIVCEYVPGGELRDELAAADGPLPLERALTVAIDICRALSFAHGRDIIHRDLKPENVWLTEERSAKLGDFGIALSLGRTRLTMAGGITGTATYMAPEQASGGDVDARSDLYAFGVLLYELVTGNPPFVGDDPNAIMYQHVNTKPESPTEHNDAVPPRLEQLIMRLLAKPKAERPGSAEEVLAELEHATAELAEGHTAKAAGRGEGPA